MLTSALILENPEDPSADQLMATNQNVLGAALIEPVIYKVRSASLRPVAYLLGGA